MHCCCSVTKSRLTLQPRELQHTRLPCPSLPPGICSNTRPLSRWCHPTISSSVAPFSSCPQSFPASGSFPVSWLFASGGQSIGASASVLPMNSQGWFPLGLIDLLAVQVTQVFSSTTVGKHQFFITQLSLRSNSHIRTWLLEKAQLWLGSLKTACESAAISNWKLNCKNKCCHKYNCFHLLITKCLLPVLGI